MARYTGPKEKIERRIGERLSIKGVRSAMGKTAITKKPYPPGSNGSKPSRKPSEFAQQLRAKQKVKNVYRLLEKQFKNYVKKATATHHEPYSLILNSLEHRLDNVVYRMGLAQSRDAARQLVNHGHITLNGRKASIPSIQVNIGDVISVREGSRKTAYFQNIAPQFLQQHEAPSWIKLDKQTMSGTVQGQSSADESGIQVDDLQAIIEFYSR
ncbi:MAG TPA: 30S ribosomal protein S4 [Candidatus Paceibacterota bacterium]|nr:30S ribosomal protein S4 [Candidatus Paceibacterota bacterium]